MNTTLGIFYGLAALVSFGLSNSISKSPTEKLGPLRAYVYRNSFTSLLLFIIVIFALPSTIELRYVGFAVLLSLLGFIPLYSFLKAIEVGKIGLVGPIAYSSSVVSIALSVIFYHERLTLLESIFLLVVIAGVILISVNLKDWRNSELFSRKSGIPYALLACVFWGIFFFLNKIPVTHLGSILTAFIVELGGLVVAFVASRKIRKVALPPQRPTMVAMAFVAILGVIGALMYNFGITQTNVSIVATLTSATPLITTIYGRIVYNERLTRLQYAAMALIVIGIVALSVK